MSIQVVLFANLRKELDKDEFNLEGRDIGEILEELTCVYDSLQDHIYEDLDEEKLKENIKILKNGRNIEFLDGLETDLQDGDKVAIFPLVGGG